MKILRLSTRDFRGLPDGSYDFCESKSEVPHAVTLVVGDAGVGKTSLLEAIIAAKEDVGAYGPARALGPCVRAGASTARVEATWLLSPAEQQRARTPSAIVTTTSIFGAGSAPIAEHPEELRAVFREHSCERGRAKVEYFHAGRALPPTRGARQAGSLGSDVRWRLTASNEKYRMLRAYVIAEVQASDEAVAQAERERGDRGMNGQRHARQRLGDAFRPFLRGKVFDGIDREGESFRLRFRASSGGLLDLDELSASEQQWLLFALTFQRLGLEHSLILIDEPELHIHASERVRFLRALAALGRDNQIIAATGATELVSAVEPGEVIELSRLAEPKSDAPPVHDDDGHETVMLKDAAIFGPALPFVSPGASPGKLLARFDPQTGQPLAAPRWVDAHAPSGGDASVHGLKPD